LFKYILSFSPLLILAFNRAISKISIGPIYFVDSWIFISVLLRPKEFFINIFKNYFAFAIVIIGIIYLIIEILNNQFTILNIRRFATALYFIIPIIITIYHNEITKAFNKYIFIIFILNFIAYFFDADNFHISLGAVVMGTILLHLFFQERKNVHNSYYLIYISMIFMYFYAVFGLNGDGIYKTPFLSLVLSIIAVIVYNIYKVIKGLKNINLNMLISIHIAILIFLVILFITPIGSFLFKEVFYAMYGLTEITAFNELAQSLGETQSRGRGSSADTSETRMYFWTGIVTYNFSDPWRLLFGNGHANSFFQQIFPSEEFLDAHLLEPHNSFMSVFYKYGSIGIFLMIGALWQTRKIMSGYVDNVKTELVIICTVTNIVYTSFEIAFESPHGAVVFWFIWLFPYLIADKKIQ